MAKKKAEDKVFPDQIFLNAAIKDGRAVRRELSMKALGDPDVRLQQRVKTDPNHVRLLEGILHDGDQLRPIVVFEDAAGKFHLADGFHRHGAHAKFGAASIRAWVISGEWRDAMVYSTMCNRNLCLKRTGDDIKKAVFTLLDDEEWRGKSDAMIGDHCGLNNNTVSKYRLEHSEARGVAIPEKVECRNGILAFYKKSPGGDPRVSRNSKGDCYTSFGGKTIYLGRDVEKAKTKVIALAKEKVGRKSSLDPTAVRKLLRRHDALFGAAGVDQKIGLGGPSVGHGVVFVPEPFGRPPNAGPSQAVPTAVGRILLARQMIDPAARAVVVCYVEDAPPELIEAGRALGVEFLTPEELVASIKTEGEADRESA